MEVITSILLIALIIAVVLFKGLYWISLARTSDPTNIPGPPAWPIIGNAGYFLGVNNVEAMEEITSVLLIALIAVLVILGLSWISLARTSEPTNIPGPPAWPIIGNAGYFLGVNNVERALEAFAKMAQAHVAPLNRIWLGPKLVVMVNSPKYLEALITHRAAATKDEFFYKDLKVASGNGVFTRSGEEWKRMRRPMANIVLPKNINNFQEVSCQKVNSLCQELEVKVDLEPVDISPYIKFFVFEIIRETTVGASSVDLEDGLFETVHRIERIIEETFVHIFSWQGMLGLTTYDPKAAIDYFIPFLSKMLDERRKQLDLQGKNYMTGKPENYTDVVLQTAGIERLNEREASVLLIDFLLAGSDTQSVAMIVLIILLAMHQEYQEKIYEELVGIFGDSDRRPEEDDLRKMVYLEMCIKESLRHCSPPTVFRSVDEDIEIDGYVIPKGAALVFTFFLIFKDPQYWERPEEFFPDHFLPEAVAKRPKGTFMPFAAGPRMCPGQQYSFQTMKTILSTLLRKFHFTTDQKYSELKFKYLLMREPVNSFVKLSKRLTKSTSVS